MAQHMEIPDHPDVACALLTGYPRAFESFKHIECEDCGHELYGDQKIYLHDGDIVCGTCLKKRILEAYSIDDLADAFDIRRTTADDYINENMEE